MYHKSGARRDTPPSSSAAGRRPTPRLPLSRSTSSIAGPHSQTPRRDGVADHAAALPPYTTMPAHMRQAELVSGETSSSASSEDFHQYARLYGPSHLIPPTDDSATAGFQLSSQLHTSHASPVSVVEGLDVYGQRVELSSAATATQLGGSSSGRWSKVLSRTIAQSVGVVTRLFSGSTRTPLDAAADARGGDPLWQSHNPDEEESLSTEQEKLRYALASDPKCIPTNYLRDRVANRGIVDAALGGSGSGVPYCTDVGGDSHDPYEWGDPLHGDYYGDEVLVEMSLGEAIVQYLNTPNEYYGNLTAALLATRDPLTNPVAADDLHLTGGNPFLVMLIVQSGALPMAYDSSIAHEIQSYVDRLVVPSRQSHGRMNPSCYEFLKCLVSIPSVTLSVSQASLMRRSGFEFVSLLLDSPHLEKDNNASLQQSWVQSMRTLLGRRLDFPLAVIGLVLVCLDFASLAIVAQYWYFEFSTYGYVTLLCYVAGYIIDLVTLLFVMRKKANSSVYEGRVTQFPSAHLKIFPLVPVYEFVLFSAILRHEWDASKKDSTGGGVGKKHRAMIHDLYATATIVRVGHSVFYSVPQSILQSYFFDWGTLEEGDASFFGYRMLLITSVACVILGLVLFMRQLTVFDSISYMGYASFGTDAKGHIVHRRSVIPRTLTFALLYLFEINVFFLVIGARNLDTCSTNTTVWIAMSAGIVASCLVIFVSSIASSTSVYRAAKWFIVPFLLETAFTIFMTIRSAETIVEECRLFVRAGGMTVIVGYVTWGVFGFLGACWLFLSFCCAHVLSEDEMPPEVDVHPPHPGFQ